MSLVQIADYLYCNADWLKLRWINAHVNSRFVPLNNTSKRALLRKMK
jgi:hypothetical protein